MRLCHRPMKPWEVSLQRTPLNFSGKFISWNGKKKQGKGGKASKVRRKFELYIFARAVSQLFPFWPFDKDSYFLTFGEVWKEFHFVVQCKTLRGKICKSRSRTKARGEHQHSPGGISGYDTFCSSVQVPLKNSFSRISRSFEVFVSFFDKLNCFL